jgi:pilus assembly protein CpaC
MHKFLVLAVAGSGFILVGASNSAQLVSPETPATVAAAPTVVAAPGEPARVERTTTAQIPASGVPILLESGKGTLIRLPRPAGTVFIANPDVADVQIKSPSLIYLNAKAPGETVLYAVDSEDRILLNAPVRVEHDLSRVRHSVSALAPGENVSVNSVDNAIVLSGNVSTAGRAERLQSVAAAIASETKGSVVNRMAVATPNQVNIRVKIAEVSRQVLKSLGINLSKPGGRIRIEGTGTFPVNQPTGPGSSLPFTGNPVTGGAITAQNLLGFIIGNQGGQITAVLDALAQEGLLTTLAEPDLTATNGQPASFLAGGEFPVPVASAATNGVQTVTIAFKTFGVQLQVTPTIIDAEHLNLRIKTEVSQLSNNGAVVSSGFSISALTTRRAETTVELGSGESFAVGGLLQNTSSQNVSKVPGLGDIPILGQLFRSDQFQRNESELVIIVTPYLVKPTETALALPTDGYLAPHDIQRIVNTDTYRQTLPPARGPLGPGNRGLIGPAGFRLD